MTSFLGGGRFKQFLKKYGKVAVGVPCSVSAATVTGLYIAINNNVDVESILQKVGFTTTSSSKYEPPHSIPPSPSNVSSDGFGTEEQRIPEFGDQATVVEKKRNRTAELVATSGGALTLAILCNKALFSIRVPIS